MHQARVSRRARQVQKRNFRRILIVRLSSLGDVIQTLPVPAAVREAYPDAEIGWAIDRELAPAIAGHPDLNHLHQCDRLRWGQRLLAPTAWRHTIGEARGFIDEIRAVGYDCALDVEGLLKSAVIPFFAGIPVRIGFGHGRELSHFFYTERYLSSAEYFDPSRMHVDHMLALAQVIGCRTDNYQIRVPPVLPTMKAQIDALLPFDREVSIVALAPATQWLSKQWPFEHWLSLLRTALVETPVNIVLIGTDDDRELTNRLIESLNERHRHRVLNLAGKTSLPQLWGIFERVSALVAADTAPLHMAGAAGCNLIGLFGATPTHRTGPVGSGNIVLITAQPKLACQPCQQRTCRFGTTECMQNVRPEAVFDALRNLIVHQGARAI